MSISNGQLANETAFNNAFMSRTEDTDTVGRISLENTETESGNQILNVQRYINEIADATGINGEGDASATVYANENVIDNGDTHKEAIEKLDAEFNTTTGHNHDGVNSPALASIVTDSPITIKQITTPSNPSAGYEKIYPKANGKFYSLISDGTETELGSGGGGGGGGSSLLWHVGSDSSAPEISTENNIEAWAFQSGETQVLRAEFKVPETFVAGSPLTIYIPAIINSNTDTNKFKLQITAYLIRLGTDAITETNNDAIVSTETSVLSTANIVQKIEFIITADGIINSIPIGGHIVLLKLERIAASSNDDSSDVLILTNGSEVKLT